MPSLSLLPPSPNLLHQSVSEVTNLDNVKLLHEQDTAVPVLYNSTYIKCPEQAISQKVDSWLADEGELGLRANKLGFLFGLMECSRISGNGFMVL